MGRRIAVEAGGCKWVWRCPGESAPACRRQELARMVLLRLMGRRQAGMSGLLKSGFRLRRPVQGLGIFEQPVFPRPPLLLKLALKA